MQNNEQNQNQRVTTYDLSDGAKLVITQHIYTDAICYRQDNDKAYGGFTTSWTNDGVVVLDNHDYGEWLQQTGLPDTVGKTVEQLEALGFYRYPLGDGEVYVTERTERVE